VLVCEASHTKHWFGKQGARQMQLRAVEVAGSICPAFDADGPEARLRAGFLRDTQGHADEILALIAQARNEPTGGVPPGWSKNEVWLAFHSDRVVVTHQWLFGDGGVECEIAVPLDEAELLVQVWEQEVAAFAQVKRPRGCSQEAEPGAAPDTAG
jgi:uncharacterized protein CbrC (UPF0167 family)